MHLINFIKSIDMNAFQRISQCTAKEQDVTTRQDVISRLTLWWKLYVWTEDVSDISDGPVRYVGINTKC
jgi:hypothetical protein